MADAREEVVSVGCRLPAGLILEVGLQTTIQDPLSRRPITMVAQTSTYRRFALRGTHEHSRPLRAQGIQVPAIRNPQPFINRNVPKALWEEWYKNNKEKWACRKGHVYLAANGDSNTKAQTLDVMGRGDAPLNPLDKDKKMKFGEDTIEPAQFEEQEAVKD
jgi:hypothetical protein